MKLKDRGMVDYRGFSLKKLNDPRFSHLKLLAGWIVYFTMFFVTEKLIPYGRCHLIHCAVDDRIPFCEVFVVPYLLWMVLVAGSLLWYMLTDVRRFKDLQIFIMVVQAIGILTYLFWPSIHDLRPAVLPRRNFFTWIVSLIYRFDTPTGILPSMHAAYSMGLVSVWLKDRNASAAWKIFVVLAVVTIILSTFLIKQHSVLDALAALPAALIAEIVVYGKRWWLPKLRGGH